MRPDRGDHVGVFLAGDHGHGGVGDPELGGLLGDPDGGDTAGLAHGELVVVDLLIEGEQAVQGGQDVNRRAGACGDRGGGAAGLSRDSCRCTYGLRAVCQGIYGGHRAR